MAQKIKLELLGITYNQIESGVYAVILQESEGKRRLPIIIGSAEAQSIECKLQDIITPRPLTHDLMVNIMRAYGISLKEVILHRLPSGVFAADLILDNGDRTLTIDSRSSDAIALAVRLGTDIYTDEEVLTQAGFDPSTRNEQETETAPKNQTQKDVKLTDITVEKLTEMMQQAVEDEKYEEAAKIKQEIERRKQE